MKVAVTDLTLSVMIFWIFAWIFAPRIVKECTEIIRSEEVQKEADSR